MLYLVVIFFSALLAVSMMSHVYAQDDVCNRNMDTPQVVALGKTGLDVKLEIEHQADDSSQIKISFLDSSSGWVQPHINYKVSIKDSSDDEIFSSPSATSQLSVMHTPTGVVTVPLRASTDGYGTAIVTVSEVNFVPIEPQSVEFHCVSAPEFPPQLIGTFAAVVSGFLVISRFKRILH